MSVVVVIGSFSHFLIEKKNLLGYYPAAAVFEQVDGTLGSRSTLEQVHNFTALL